VNLSLLFTFFSKTIIMNLLKYLLLLLALLVSAQGFAQKVPATITDKHTPVVRLLAIEPGIGIHTSFGVDLLLTNLIQWNPYKRLSVASYSSFNVNNITRRSFNHIKTNYNYSINQKFGVGTSLYSKRSTHTFLLMVGAKYTRFKETLDSDDFEKTGVALEDLSPDYGLMYSLKRGWKKYFFTIRTYLPLYPWPTKGSNTLYLDGNMKNISLEIGIGMQIR